MELYRKLYLSLTLKQKLKLASYDMTVHEQIEWMKKTLGV